MSAFSSATDQQAKGRAWIRNRPKLSGLGAGGQDGDMDNAAERLVAERARTLQRLSDLTRDFDSVVSASRDTNADDEHDPEGATIAFERSQIAALTRQTRQHLEEVESALSRIHASTYGLCHTCGRPIAPERLEARPTARACIRCAAL
jgi:RNA polymerase-binding protein DksA